MTATVFLALTASLTALQLCSSAASSKKHIVCKITVLRYQQCAFILTISPSATNIPHVVYASPRKHKCSVLLAS